MLLEELAGGVVVLDGEPGAGYPVVLGRLFYEGQRRFGADATKIADSDLDRIGRERACDQRAQTHEDADKQSDHGCSLRLPSTD
jgi:hypothetical protein